MGIDTAIRKVLESTCPEAFFDGDTINLRDGVIIRDTLTDMFKAKSPNGGSEFTGAEILAYLYQFAAGPFKSGAAHTVILCMDNNTLVPPEKGAEQKRRDKKRAPDAQPYPDRAELCAAGVRIGAVESKLDIKRMMANRGLRAHLWEYFVGALASKRFVPPVGCTLIIDHCLEGAYAFGHNDWGLTRGNVLGEADLKIPYWVIRYASMPVHIVIHSIDSDFLPILLGVVRKLGHKMKCKISLRYWFSLWCDIRGAYEYLQKTHPLSIHQWIIACILCGSDYVEKARVFNGIGHATLFRLFKPKTSILECLDLDDVSARKVMSLGPDETAFTKLTEYVYATKAVRGGRPTIATIKEVGAAVRFNMNYWFRDWLDEETFPQSPIDWEHDVRLSNELRQTSHEVKASDPSKSTISQVNVGMGSRVRKAIAYHGKRHAIAELEHHEDNTRAKQMNKRVCVSSCGFIVNE